MGIYIFNRKLLFDLLEKDKKMLLILEKRSFHLQLVNIKVISYQYEGYWTDIGEHLFIFSKPILP